MGASLGPKSKNAFSAIKLEKHQIEMLGEMERFRDQGEAVCECASALLIMGEREEAAKLFQRARDIGAAHGFFSVECRACRVLTPNHKLRTPNPKPQTPNPKPQSQPCLHHTS